MLNLHMDRRDHQGRSRTEATRSHGWSRRSGIAATEFAVALPLLILLCLASVDLARHAHVAIVLENAVRVGAEYGAARRVTSYTYAGWQGEVTNRVRADFGEGPWNDSLIVDAQVSSLSEELPHIVVTGEYSFETIVPWWMLPDTIVMQRKSSIQRFR